MKYTLIIAALIFSSVSHAETDASKQVLNDLATQGATTANSTNGETLWNRAYKGVAPFTERSCTTCHGTELKTQGEHVKTGKPIQALAPSVNKKSLTDVRKINKWLLRNCKWTLGRECNAQEKADLLSFINQQ